MLYNDIITYNHNNITYTGTVQINVPGISNPIIIGNITVAIAVEEDFSNVTTIGYVTFDYVPGGIVTIEASQEQAEALVGASAIYINSSSGEIGIVTQESGAVTQSDAPYLTTALAEVSIESV